MKKYIKPNIDLMEMEGEELMGNTSDVSNMGGVSTNSILGDDYSSTDESYSKRIINFADYNDDDMAWDE